MAISEERARCERENTVLRARIRDLEAELKTVRIAGDELRTQVGLETDRAEAAIVKGNDADELEALIERMESKA